MWNEFEVNLKRIRNKYKANLKQMLNQFETNWKSANKLRQISKIMCQGEQIKMNSFVSNFFVISFEANFTEVKF